jgi:hypothetical protein
VSLKNRAWILVAMISIGLSLSTPELVAAQTSDSTASTPKQVAHAKRKADRKAARATKNVELKKLEKNGYNPAGNENNYPQNLQNAQSKATGGTAASAP